MKPRRSDRFQLAVLVPGILAALALAALAFWLLQGAGQPLERRVPGTDHAPGSELGAGGNVVQAGKLLKGEGQPAQLPGSWPQFRGPNHDGLSAETGLLRTWPPSGPHELWAIDAGEGYAGVSVLNGRVYLMDYDR
jgi:outer membrane protein assembly factor BamB